jgi:K+-sensing histidine kinase KdpD
MDLLFDNLPAPDPKTLFEIVSGIRTDFVKKYPLCSIELSGPEENCAFIHGSWLVIALNELLENAGEAAGAEGIINFSWKLNSEMFTFTITNSGETIQYLAEPS